MFYSKLETFSLSLPVLIGNKETNKVFSWEKCLEVILETEFSGPLDDDACGLYQMEITETPNGTENYFIFLSSDNKSITPTSPDGRQPDVSVQLSSADLASVLEGM